jgi:hypothetical protein
MRAKDLLKGTGAEDIASTSESSHGVETEKVRTSGSYCELSARLPKSGPNLAKRYAEPVWVRPPAGFTRMKSLSHLM